MHRFKNILLLHDMRPKDSLTLKRGVDLAGRNQARRKGGYPPYLPGDEGGTSYLAYRREQQVSIPPQLRQEDSVNSGFPGRSDR